MTDALTLPVTKFRGLLFIWGPLCEQSCDLWNRKKSAEAMWKKNVRLKNVSWLIES